MTGIGLNCGPVRGFEICTLLLFSIRQITLIPTSIEQWLGAMRRYWYLSALAFIVPIALTVAVILMAPRAYRSEAKLLLRIGRESVTVDPTVSTVGETLSLHHTRENEIQSALGVMHSREIIERVVDHVGVETVLEGTPATDQETEPGKLAWLRDAVGAVTSRIESIDPIEPRESAITRLSRSIDVYAAAESSVVSISYETDSPEVAQSVIAAWIDSYIAQHAKVNRTPGSYSFFEQQGMVLRDQLGTARETLQAAKNGSNLVTVDGQQKLLESQLSKVRDGMIDVESEIASLTSRVKTYQSMLAGFDETIVQEVSGIANEGRDSMRTALFELEVQEKDLRSKYNDGHPKLVAIERQVAQAAAIVEDQTRDRKEVTRSINPAYQQLVEYKMLDEASLAGLVEKKTSLEQKRESLETELTLLNRNEQIIAAASNDVAILEDRYAAHAEKMEQARLDEVLADQRITSVNVVQPASLEKRPVTPNKPLCLLAGLMAALAAGISVPVLVDLRQSGRRQVRVSRTGRSHSHWDSETDSNSDSISNSDSNSNSVSKSNSVSNSNSAIDTDQDADLKRSAADVEFDMAGKSATHAGRSD